MERLRRDSLWMGIFLGFFIPALVFGILYGIMAIIEHSAGKTEIVSLQKLILLSIIPNLFLLRYYLLKLKFDNTGRGILAITFVIAILFVILEIFSK